MSEIEQQIAYLRKRAYFLYEHGQYDRAASVADQVFRLTKQYRGEKHFDVAASLGDLATAFLAMSNFQGARAAMHEAIGILRELPGKEFQGVLAINLEKLAELHNRLGDAAAAAKALQESIDILRTTLGPNHPVVSMSLLNLAELYFRQDDHIAAELLFREGFELAGSTLDKTHPAVALSLGDFAEIYVRRGDYLAAEPLLRDTVELIGRVGGEEDPEYAQSLNNLAILYHEMGDYAKAEPLLNQALKIRENVLGEHSPAVATSLNNLAVLYLSKNLFPAAFMYAQRALEIWRGSRQEQHPKYAMALANLAHSYEQMVPYIHGAYQEAAALYTAARGIVRNTHGEDHPFYATALQDLARLHFSQGDYGSAELLYREVAEIDKKGLGKNHPHYATDLCDLAMTLAATKRASEAMQMFKDAAVVKDHAIAEIFSFGSESQRMAYVATLHAQLNASLSLVVDHLAYSSADVKTALEWVLRRKAIGVEAIAVQRDAVLGGRYPELATRLQELTRLRMQIARKILNGPGAADLDLYRGQLDEWDKQKEEHEKELAEHIPEMRIEQQLRSVDCQKVAATLPAGSALVEFVRFDLFDFDAVPGRREEQWKPPRYLAFVVLAEAPEDIRLVCLGDAAQIDKLIGRFRRVLTGEVMQDRDKGKIIAISTTTPASCERDPSAMRDTIKAVRRLQNMRALIEDTAEVSEPRAAELEAEVRQVGAEVRHAVFDPLLAALHGHTRLFLAPDGDLNRLPFEVLPLDDGRYSIDEYQFSYLTTGRDLLRFSVPVRGKPLPPLVVADPDFALSVTRSRRAIMPFRRLKGTHAEATGLAELLKIMPIVGAQALEGRLKALLSPDNSPCILHLSTHGFFLPDPPDDPNAVSPTLESGNRAGGALGRLAGRRLPNPLLRSGLALAGANTWLCGDPLPLEAEDGILFAEDVTGLDLLNTELVVLSACDTGLGDIQAGEGIFGLRRAFVLAGAKTLVMSLWKVRDRQTQELMLDFYVRILRGEGRAEALRQAQLALKARYPHPRYWAAFICQGDPSPVASFSQTS